jgi:hypothetical protein
MTSFEEALLDAVSGRFEKLATFGIVATRTGDLVRLSCDGASQLVPNTPEALTDALYSIPQELTYRDYCQR